MTGPKCRLSKERVSAPGWWTLNAAQQARPHQNGPQPSPRHSVGRIARPLHVTTKKRCNPPTSLWRRRESKPRTMAPSSLLSEGCVRLACRCRGHGPPRAVSNHPRPHRIARHMQCEFYLMRLEPSTVPVDARARRCLRLGHTGPNLQRRPTWHRPLPGAVTGEGGRPYA